MPVNISNLPSRVPRIYGFKDNQLDIKFLFPTGYNLSNVSAKLFYGEKYRTGLVSISVVGSLVTATLTREDFIAINLPVFEFFLYVSNTARIGATIEIQNKPGTPVSQSFDVTLIDGQVINVDIIDATVSEQNAQLAIQAALEAIQANEEAQAIVPALQTDINGRIPLSQKGIANGVGTLGSDLFQPLSQVKPNSIPIPNTESILSNFLKTGNTYYGIKSSFTGQDIYINQIVNKVNGSPIQDSDIDNIIYFKLSDGKYARRSLSNYEIKIEEFGGKGDGLTDNTDAINKAQNYLNEISNERGGVIMFGSGIYKSKKIILKSRISIKGSGDGVSILSLMDNQNTDFIFIPKTSFLIGIYDLSIDGNKENNLISGHNISFEANSDSDGAIFAQRNKTIDGNSTYRFATISNVSSRYSRGNGLNIPGANYLVYVNHFFANQNDKGIYNRSNDNFFNNIVCERNDTIGVHEEGSNNKWSSYKLIWNGSLESSANFGCGLYISNSFRCSFQNGETQDNFGDGVRLNSVDSLMMTNHISDCNGYMDNNLTTDGVSCGFKLINVSNSILSACKATNYKQGNTRPWIQTYGYSEEYGCFNNNLDISMVSQEKPPISISQSLLNINNDFICKRNNPYTLNDITYEIDEPVFNNGVIITNNDRIQIPCVIPYSNQLSYFIEFEFLGIDRTTPKIIASSNAKITITYIVGSPNYIQVSLSTPTGFFGVAQLTNTFISGTVYKLYFEFKRFNSGMGRSKVILSYLDVNDGVVFLKAATSYPNINDEVKDVIENIYFNNYNVTGAATEGNFNMRLIKFGLSNNPINEDYLKANYIINNSNLFTIYRDFSNVNSKSMNVIKGTSSLPMANKFYLNKTYITDKGMFVCVKLIDGTYEFISLNNRIKTYSAVGNGTSTITIPHGLGVVPKHVGYPNPISISSPNPTYTTKDITNIYLHFANNTISGSNLLYDIPIED